MPELKLVEEVAGVGELSAKGQMLGSVQYRIDRFQGMQEGNGLPIPGLHRIEGRIEGEALAAAAPHVGEPLVLRLEDGRALGITLADAGGRVLSEGHGPMRCLCC
jgi:hypothetical protein